MGLVPSSRVEPASSIPHHTGQRVSRRPPPRVERGGGATGHNAWARRESPVGGPRSEIDGSGPRTLIRRATTLPRRARARLAAPTRARPCAPAPQTCPQTSEAIGKGPGVAEAIAAATFQAIKATTQARKAGRPCMDAAIQDLEAPHASSAATWNQAMDECRPAGCQGSSEVARREPADSPRHLVSPPLLHEL